MDSKNVIAAISLSAAVIILYSLFFAPTNDKLKQKKYIIAGIGAAAKANTLINTFGLNTKHIDFITDASKHKIGKFTPKSRIPIFNDKILTRYENIYAIILSWNISKTLIKLNL